MIETLELPEGRLAFHEAMAFVTRLMSLPEEVVVEAIPELAMTNLGFGVGHIGSSFRDCEIGRANAALTQDFYTLRIPVMNKEGVPQDLPEDINRLYMLNPLKGIIAGVRDFYGDSDWLRENGVPLLSAPIS